jgi:hypothetical protein
MPVLSPNSELVPLSVYVYPEQKEYLLSLTRGRAYSMSNVVRDMIRDRQVQHEFPSLDIK